MMKFLSKTVALAGITATVGGLAWLVCTVKLSAAERVPLPQMPALFDQGQGGKQPLADSMQMSQATSQPDLALLAKAGTLLLQSDRFQTESEIQIKATSNGTNLDSSAKAVTIVQSPQKIRSEIYFSGSESGKKPDSLVISNGKQVWISRPKLKQYAVMPYSQFDQVDDSFWVGMSSLWFLDISPEARAAIAKGGLSDPEVQKELGLAKDFAIEGSPQTVDGQDVYVYSYTVKGGYVLRAFLDPKTATLQQIVLTGKTDGLDIVMTERIVRRVASPTVTASTFQSPPLASQKRVKTLAIGPL